jgi:hypothetical protein
MDRAAAERAVRDYIAEYGPGTLGGELFRAGRFYLLAGDAKEARAVIGRANGLGPSDLTLLFEALLADAVGDAAARDSALKRFDGLPAEKNLARPIGAAIREWSSAGVAPDAAAVEAALGKVVAEYRADGEYLFGWYLHNRKQKDRAAALWGRCLATKGGTLWLKTHARAGVESTGRKTD